MGEKTALTLLADFETLDGIYEHIENIKSKSVQAKLSTAKEMAYLSKKLVTIDCYAPVDVTLDQFEFKPDWLKVQQTFADYEFKRLIDRISDFAKLPSNVSETSSVETELSYIPTSYSMIDSNQKLDQLLPLLEKGFAFDLETTSLDPQDADIVAISITASKGISFVIDCRQTEPLQTDLFNFDEQKKFHPLFERLIPLFEDDGFLKFFIMPNMNIRS